ncbi:MAG: hypothetical protein K8L99_26220 [Anaerolineae bacterium]|nr:hypothetical protein [Anaerolineae bacterium]
MQIRVDVYDADGVKVGEGPITTVIRASVERMLDGAGSISFSVPAHDTRAADLLQKERRVRLYVDDFGENLREVGRGIIRKRNYKASEGQWELTIDGPDMLDELKRRTVGINEEYENQTVKSIVEGLVDLVPGWSAECDVLDRLTARFDAVSVLKTLQKVCELQGLHLRFKLGVDSNVVQVGVFGEDAGLTLVNTDYPPLDPSQNREVAFLQDYTHEEDSEPIVNRLYPFGAGQNVDAALSLELSNRNDPAIQSVVLNNRRLYYIENAASIAALDGEIIEQFGQFKEIGPLENTDAFEELAANALHDAANAWLERRAFSQNNYAGTVRGHVKTINTGDKLTLDYVDVIEQAGKIIPIEQVKGEMWVMKAQENFSENGVILSLQLSDIDRHQQTAASVVIGSIEAIELQGTTVQPSFNHSPFGPEQVLIDSSNTGTVDLIISSKVLKVLEVTMRVRTKPFTATATAAQTTTSADGGDHYHLLGTFVSDASSVSAKRMLLAKSTTWPVPTLPLTAFIAEFQLNGGSVGDGWFTSSSSGDHSHTIPAASLDYGIYRDTERPGGMGITVNGVTVAEDVGDTTLDFDETFDITEAVLNRGGGFRGVHPVVISAAEGQGEVLVTFDVWSLVNPFKPPE